MSEERVKTKDEINNLSPSTEVNISYQVDQNKIQTSENLNNNLLYTKVYILLI